MQYQFVYRMMGGAVIKSDTAGITKATGEAFMDRIFDRATEGKYGLVKARVQGDPILINLKDVSSVKLEAVEL